VKRTAADDVARAAYAAAVLGAVLSVVAAGMYGWRAGASLAAGAVIGVANLVALRAIIRALMAPPEGEAESAGAEKEKKSEADEAIEREAAREAGLDESEMADGATRAQRKDDRMHRAAGRRGGIAWGIFAMLKIALLFGGVYVLLTRELVDPIALAAGYGVLPLGIFASTAWSSMKPTRRVSSPRVRSHPGPDRDRKAADK